MAAVCMSMIRYHDKKPVRDGVAQQKKAATSPDSHKGGET